MNLCQFLQSSTTCPVCDEPLILFMQEIDGDLWRARVVEPNLYRFDRMPLKLDEHRNDVRNKNVACNQICVRSPDDFIWIKDKGDNFEMGFNGFVLEEFMRLQEVFFFNMCGADSFKERFAGNYIIEAYKACYYRSSALMNLQLVGEDWKLLRSSVTDQPANVDIRDEIFTFKYHRDDSSEKVYILNLDYESNKTLFRYYTFTLDESKSADFEPEYFEKDLPPLPTRPNFKIEDRASLIDRMNGWILMS